MIAKSKTKQMDTANIQKTVNDKQVKMTKMNQRNICPDVVKG